MGTGQSQRRHDLDLGRRTDLAVQLSKEESEKEVNMIGKDQPKAELKESYYESADNNHPEKKKAMVKQLEKLLPA